MLFQILYLCLKDLLEFFLLIEFDTIEKLFSLKRSFMYSNDINIPVNIIFQNNLNIFLPFRGENINHICLYNQEKNVFLNKTC